LYGVPAISKYPLVELLCRKGFDNGTNTTDKFKSEQILLVRNGTIPTRAHTWKNSL
jgi:hypothetical protein